MAKRLFIIIIFIGVNSYINAQNRAVLYTHLGTTTSFSSFSSVDPIPESIKQSYFLSVNNGFGFGLYHKTNWFLIYSWSNFKPTPGYTLFNDNEEKIGGSSIRVRYWNHTISLGKEYALNDTDWAASWMGGVSFAKIKNFLGTTSILGKRESSEDYVRNGINRRGEIMPGIESNLQIGGKITKYLDFRRSSFSLRVLLNKGFYTYATHSAVVEFNEGNYEFDIKAKSDFFAVMIQYEVYLGKLNE